MKNKMKHIATAAALGVVALLASCVSRQVAVEAESRSDSLELVVSAKVSLINAVFADINAISENLALIKSRENLITVAGESEGGRRPVEEIDNDIKAIDRLLRENRAKIESLQRSAAQLRKANLRIDGLEKMIADMNRQLAEKKAEVEQLRESLVRMGDEEEPDRGGGCPQRRGREPERREGRVAEPAQHGLLHRGGREGVARRADHQQAGIHRTDADRRTEQQFRQLHDDRFAPAVGGPCRTEEGDARHFASRGVVRTGDRREQGRRETDHHRSRAVLGVFENSDH